MFGGTFDPVHVGHVVVAAETRAATRASTGCCSSSPATRGRSAVASWRTPPTDSRSRRTAVDGIDGVEASAIEIERGEASVTADTLEALSAPDRELFLVLGADAVANMPTWRRLDETRHLATVVVVERAGDVHSEPPGRRLAGRAGLDPAPRHLVDRPAGSAARRGARSTASCPRQSCARSTGGASTLTGDDARSPPLDPLAGLRRPCLRRPPPSRDRRARRRRQEGRRTSSCSTSATSSRSPRRSCSSARANTRARAHDRRRGRARPQARPTSESPRSVEGLERRDVGAHGLRRRRSCTSSSARRARSTTSTGCGPTRPRSTGSRRAATPSAADRPAAVHRYGPHRHVALGEAVLELADADVALEPRRVEDRADDRGAARRRR